MTKDWSDRAACAGLPGDLFFGDVWPADDSGEDGPLDQEAYENAVAICAVCPVRTACFTAAMAEEAGAAMSRRFGVRGGLTPAQRYSVWRRDSMSCERCHEVYDPSGVAAGEMVCSCGSFDEPPIPAEFGDEWFPRHDGLLERLVKHLLETTSPGDRILPPYRMLKAMGHRRKDDLPLVYERLIADGLIRRGEGRGEYFRAAGKGALASWVPPSRRHRAGLVLRAA